MGDILLGTSYIVKTPGVVGGRPRLAGRRIAVDFIVDLYVRQNTSVEEIEEHFSVTPAETYAALSYYYDHQAEIDDLLLESDAHAEALMTIGPDGSLNPEQTREAIALAERLIESRKEELTATEIARHYGITTGAVRQAALKGQIPARKSGATWLIKRADAESRWGSKK